MTNDWFDALTNPRLDLPESSAADDGAQQLLADCRPALELIRSGMPENGINLVPRWEEFLAGEKQSAGPPKARGFWRSPQASRLYAVGRYAAVLLVGVAIGLMAVGRVGGEAKMASALPAPHYNDQQQQLMVAMLDATRQPAAQTLRLAAVELASCVTCHDSALRQRLRASP